MIDAIEAASLAPLPGNLSFLKYLIIDNSETIEKIAVISHAKLAGKKPAYKVLSLLEQSLLLGKDIAVAGEDEKTIASFIDGKLWIED